MGLISEINRKKCKYGCIRMFNQDIEELFEIIPKGNKGNISKARLRTGKGEFKNLSVGSKGNLVQLVQERLKGLGIYEERLTVFMIFRQRRL